MTQMTVVPAVYTRPYPKTQADLEAAWAMGKDFRILPFGPYCSIRDVDALKVQGVTVIVLKLPMLPNKAITIEERI